MRIAFIYTKGRIARLDAAREGKAASEFFYGGIELQNRGHEIEFYEVDNEHHPSLKQKVIDFLFRCHLLPSRINGSLLTQLFELKNKLNKVDIVITTTTGISLAAGTMKALGILRTPVVAFCLGLISYKHSWLRKRVNGLVLRQMWPQLFGDSELEGMRQVFNIPKERIFVNQFGVDSDFWIPDECPKEKFILSIGNDFRRDYDLLIRIASQIDYPFLIVTARSIKNNLPSNVTIIPGTWPSNVSIDAELREWYRMATCLLIPLKESIQPSGQSVCLQAMSCGKPVILTNTRGIWSKSMMRNQENVILVPPNDIEPYINCIQKLMNTPFDRQRIGLNARETVCREGNIHDFVNRLEKICEDIHSIKKSKKKFIYSF